MTGCVAPDCTNSDEKGFIMKIFPRDLVRRAQWAANVNRKEWIPTERSFLCEVHFAHDMWENNRVDGKRKLKINAVPTIFGSEAKKIKSHRENMRHASLNDEVGCVNEHNMYQYKVFKMKKKITIARMKCN
ncbi:unnamed protein product [Lasius platythorax]|uniref:THAP-type domain-containing protein n=1 Tax=Lasius platythorax TaxID=488582 RepID=A0AAV2P0R2_9HYME